jgi:hypothetical protein
MNVSAGADRRCGAGHGVLVCPAAAITVAAQP